MQNNIIKMGKRGSINNSTMFKSNIHKFCDAFSQRSIFKKLILCLLALCLILVLSLWESELSTLGESKTLHEPVYKYYTSIEIKRGDTLWSLAKTYISEEYSSIQEYINEIKSLNNISEDMIHSGRFLTIPYYSNNFQ
ncbi:LysM peptidoglycan-binding domain-containing protein [Lachnospiraceae bacterium ZAX-1]